MAAKTLEDVTSACGVEPLIASQLVQMGWTVQSFACVALDMESFDKLWMELLPEEEFIPLTESITEGCIQDVSGLDTDNRSSFSSSGCIGVRCHA